MEHHCIQKITQLIQGTLVGNDQLKISHPEEITKANETQITFIGNRKYEKLWDGSNAIAAVVGENCTLIPGKNKAFIKVKNVEVAMIELLHFFAPKAPEVEGKIDKTAVIHPTAELGEGTQVGAGSYIGKNTRIGKNVIIYPNVSVLDDCSIGDGSVLWPGAVIRENCHIGKHCILHPNATIGSDGFGFIPHPEGLGLLKVPQIGNVILGNGVEIGSGSSVDRGKFSSTVLGDGCKIDNLVQIGHNCQLGMFCIMAGNSGLAGSVTLGNGVVIGGSASIKDHTTIGDGATIGAGSGVTCDVAAQSTVLGYPALPARETLKQWAFIKRLVRES